MRERVRSGIGGGFLTGKRFQIRCPLSPILFNLLIVDLEETMSKRREYLEEREYIHWRMQMTWSVLTHSAPKHIELRFYGKVKNIKNVCYERLIGHFEE